VSQALRLPPRLRPAVLAFGTLADGFLPFLPPEASGRAACGSAASCLFRSQNLLLAQLQAACIAATSCVQLASWLLCI
jgi:hypothetical protein